MSRFERGRLLGKRVVYEGRIVDLEVDEIEIKGLKTIREIVRHPGGVVVLAERSDGRIPFVRQHRYPPDRDLLELPAGKIDRGEDPDVTAARELEEETGLRPRSIDLVGSFYSSPGYCDELLRFYYAPSVEEAATCPEIDEELEIEFYTLQEALDLAAAGEIQDAKTLAALYWLFWRNSSR